MQSMTMTDTTKSKRGPISFHTLYDRRLAKKGWTWMTYYDVMEFMKES